MWCNRLYTQQLLHMCAKTLLESQHTWDLTISVQKYRKKGPCWQSGVATGDAWHSVLRSDQWCDGAGQGLLTPEIDYRTARTIGRSPSQTQKDSLTEQPRVSSVPEAISAARTCGRFPGELRHSSLRHQDVVKAVLEQPRSWFPSKKPADNVLMYLNQLTV